MEAKRIVAMFIVDDGGGGVDDDSVQADAVLVVVAMLWLNATTIRSRRPPFSFNGASLWCGRIMVALSCNRRDHPSHL